MRSHSRVSTSARSRRTPNLIQRQPAPPSAEEAELPPPSISAQLQAARRGHSLSRAGVGNASFAAQPALAPYATLTSNHLAVQRAPKPTKAVSSEAMQRLNVATDAIKHTKEVFQYGAGNQQKALRNTKFNSYFRMQAMRNESLWSLTSEAEKIANENPEALTAAKADLMHGGNCGEHADVAFDYLRLKAIGQLVNLSDVEGLDHAFVIIGDVSKEEDASLAVADAWPTKATATLWEDHFAYTSDRTQINVRHSMLGDGKNIKEIIAAGLTLSEEGQEMARQSLSRSKVEQEIKASREEEHPWIWNHADAAAEGHKFKYNLQK